ncbi:MAG TPA: hypothetical protein VFU47_04495 [Armatimonadota bacterium]|nr:hypothetical protein [Armatimonadota bacterium]
MQSPVHQTDEALAPYLRSADDAEARRRLEALIRELDPVITGIIRRKLRVVPGGPVEREGAAAEDVRGEVLVQVLARLEELRRNPDGDGIANLRGFVAVSAYRVCDSHLRKKYPQRASLKNKLSYLLTKRAGQEGLALWDAGGDRLAGFEAWREEGRPLVRNARYQQLVERPRAVVEQAFPGQDPKHANPGELVAALFNWTAGPVELDDLVNVVAQLWEVRDAVEPPPEPRGEESADPYRNLADPRPAVETEAEQRAYLQALWAEIRQLPPRQCAALLLNLRDAQGRGVIALLPILRIATIREIAAALGFAAERFAELWNELPVEDNAIAELLGCTRQQVINLRKVARERLGRRMRALEAA